MECDSGNGRIQRERERERERERTDSGQYRHHSEKIELGATVVVAFAVAKLTCGNDFSPFT